MTATTNTRLLELPLVDRERGRRLPTHLHLPADTPPWPLVAFAHGWMGHPRKFTRLLSRWSAAGYAVAAPAFPNTNEASSGKEFEDVANQPADIGFVLDSLLDDERFARDRVAVTGFSLGAVTALAAAFGPTRFEPRVNAVIAIAGRLPWFGEGCVFRRSPLLVVHGAFDTVVAYEDGVGVYRRAYPPKALLTITIPGHDQFVQDEPPTPADTVVADVTTAFLQHVFDAVKAPPRVDSGVAELESEGLW